MNCKSILRPIYYLYFLSFILFFNTSCGGALVLMGANSRNKENNDQKKRIEELNDLLNKVDEDIRKNETLIRGDIHRPGFGKPFENLTLDLMATGGQPGPVKVTGAPVVLGEEGSLSLDSRIRIDRFTGLNWRGKKPPLKSQIILDRTYLDLPVDSKSSTSNSTDQTSQQRSKIKYLNFGCDLSKIPKFQQTDFTSSEALEEDKEGIQYFEGETNIRLPVNESIPDYTFEKKSIIVKSVFAENIFLCNGDAFSIGDPYDAITFSADFIYFSNFSHVIQENLVLLALNAKTLWLEGRNNLDLSPLDSKLTSNDFSSLNRMGIYFRLDVFELDGNGQFHLTTHGSNHVKVDK